MTFFNYCLMMPPSGPPPSTRCLFMQALQKLDDVSLKEAAQWACVVNLLSTQSKLNGVFFKAVSAGNEDHIEIDCKVVSNNGECPSKCEKNMIDQLEDDLECARSIGFSYWQKEGYQKCFRHGWLYNIVLCTNVYIPLPEEPGNHEIEREKLVEVLETLSDSEREYLDEYFSQSHVDEEHTTVLKTLERDVYNSKPSKQEIEEEAFRER